MKNKIKKKVIIIGAGPGALSAAMVLAHNGLDVHVYEKKDIVGGRNGFIQAGEYKFDIGPTFFLMLDVAQRLFELTGRKMENYINVEKLDPMYRLAFKDKDFFPSSDKAKMIKEMEKVFPGSSKGYEEYLKREEIKYQRLIPCLEKPYGKITDFLSMRLVKALPYLDAHISLFDNLARYYSDDTLKTCFTFQAKYIGMSPWEAPGLFSIISYIEHGGGVFHIHGGLHKLSQAMANVLTEEGGTIHLNSEVKRIIVEGRAAKGIELTNGEIVKADYVVINADFAQAMTKLVDSKFRDKYTDAKLAKMKYSCSTFMLYLGLNKVYDNINHHNIFFADDYKHNIAEITSNSIISEDPSFYVHNPSLIDKTLAPEGKSSVYVLVPTGNTSGGIDWNTNKEAYKEKILNLLETKAKMTGIRDHIEELRMITPDDWENKLDVYNGATFNLGHNMTQMLYFRPHNEFEEFENCYLVGGGTHPGSGIPTILESGRISAKLIIDKAFAKN